MFQHKLDALVEARDIEWIAQRCGLSATTVGDWRRGASPSLEAVQQLADGLDIDVCYFADRKKRIRDFPHLRPDTDDEGHSMVKEDSEEFLAAEAPARYNRGRKKRKVTKD